MLLRYFYDKKLAQASYLVGCQATGEALVIDPTRDIGPYLRVAEEENLRIAHVAETHIHADFVSGSRELAACTGATLYLSDMGDETWKYQFTERQTQLIKGGDGWMVGNIRVEAIATPGHTPEHVIFAITDTTNADQPMGLFTGDCLFIGSIGRPDLLEKAAGIKGTMEKGARQQFKNLQLLRGLPDYLQIWPGHGAGSACGKALGALPSSTLGYEKRFNPAFQFGDEDSFVHWLLEDQPEPPAYFAQMKKVNKTGPRLLGELAPPLRLPAEKLPGLLDQGAFVIDTRTGDEFAAGHIPGTINIPVRSNSFNTYVGWLVDYTKPVYLIAPLQTLDTVLRQLYAIGVDDIGGYFTPESVASLQTATITQITPNELAAMCERVQLLDVRNQSEVDEKRIAGSLHITMGYLLDNLHCIDGNKPVVLQCASGTRSQIGCCLLIKCGITQVMNLRGGLDAWLRAGLPVETGRAEPTHA